MNQSKGVLPGYMKVVMRIKVTAAPGNRGDGEECLGSWAGQSPPVLPAHFTLSALSKLKNSLRDHLLQPPLRLPGKLVLEGEVIDARSCFKVI